MRPASEREGVKVMKRLICAVLAVILSGTTAAVADPYDHGGQSFNEGYDNRDHSTYYRGHGDNNGGAVVAGIGLLALAAILASQHRHHWHRGWYGHDGYRYGDSYRYGQGYGTGGASGYGGDYGYNGGYGNEYGNGHDGWGDRDRH
jgi:hypothetical protein